jgi:hypothetical protein
MILACCQEGDITKVRLWSSLGVDVLYSARPLIRAVDLGHGQEGVVQYLIEELGADVNQATTRGLTPFNLAAATGNVGMLRSLGNRSVLTSTTRRKGATRP